MTGREPQKENDLFFTCSFVEYIARKTKNITRYIVHELGKENIAKIYDLADVYHCENIEKISDEFIDSCNIEKGSFDNVSICEYDVPTYWDIGKVFKRLILMIAKSQNISIVDALFMAYDSIVCDKIEDYNSSFFYDSPQNIFNAFENPEYFNGLY
ncbi:MAG: hypothetical protein R3Y27_00790 [Clostridia bacterium]